MCIVHNALCPASGETAMLDTQGASIRTITLWPSETTVLRALPDSRIAIQDDGAMAVETGVMYAWPGVRMDFCAGEGDLSAYARVTVCVSNKTERTLTVHLSIKGRDGESGTIVGQTTLAPQAEGEIIADMVAMPWALDSPLELFGMRGFPISEGADGALNPRQVRSFHIFLNKSGKEGAFSVRHIHASGMRTPPKMLQANAFLPFVDKYGQFAHGEWPGKIHGDDDLAAAREREEAWLSAHTQSPVPDADKYGGWGGGPQLKATGAFRTEKVGGKWWLVDPDGRLFFSHGINAVRFDSPTGISFRENYFSWLPGKDDAAFGAFRGRFGTPAAHGFYKDAAHLPFETFDFAKANAMRKYGASWESHCAELAHKRMLAWGMNTIANWSADDVDK